MSDQPFDLEAAKRMCAAATPGPWYQDDTHVTRKPGRVAPDVLKASSPEDAAFCVHARTAFPHAIAVIEQLAAALRRTLPALDLGYIKERMACEEARAALALIKEPKP